VDLKSTIDRSINNALIFVAASLPAKAVFLYQSCKRVRRYRRQASSHKSSALLLRRINLIQHSVAAIELKYDADGHMIRDEKNRELEYDSLGRLTEVSALPGETPSGYSYDPVDKLVGRDGSGDQEQRFYRNGDLVNQIQGSSSSTFMSGQGVVLAEQQVGDGPKS